MPYMIELQLEIFLKSRVYSTYGTLRGITVCTLGLMYILVWIQLSKLNKFLTNLHPGHAENMNGKLAITQTTPIKCQAFLCPSLLQRYKSIPLSANIPTNTVENPSAN